MKETSFPTNTQAIQLLNFYRKKEYNFIYIKYPDLAFNLERIYQIAFEIMSQKSSIFRFQMFINSDQHYLLVDFKISYKNIQATLFRTLISMADEYIILVLQKYIPQKNLYIMYPHENYDLPQMQISGSYCFILLL